MSDPRLATLGGAALLALGVGAVLAPRASARGYGIAVNDAAGGAYVRGCGVRDAALGAIVLWHLARDDRPAAASVLRLANLVALGDAAAILTGRDVRRSRLAIHLGGIPALLFAAARLSSG